MFMQLILMAVCVIIETPQLIKGILLQSQFKYYQVKNQYETLNVNPLNCELISFNGYAVYV